jgi:hypothetical protein
VDPTWEGRTAMVQIKGTAVLDTIRVVKGREGEQRFKAILALLDDETKPIFEGEIFDASWYPLNGFVAFLAASLRLTGDDEKVLIRRSEAVVERQLRGVYRVFVRLRSPESILKRMGIVHQTYFTGVGIRVEIPEQGRANIRFSGFEAQHRLLEYVIIGFYRKALELCGAKLVAAEFTVPMAAAAKYCELSVTWR